MNPVPFNLLLPFPFGVDRHPGGTNRSRGVCAQVGKARTPDRRFWGPQAQNTVRMKKERRTERTGRTPGAVCGEP